MTKIELRPYQRECLGAIRDAYKRGRRRVLVSLPTGTGKTVVFASFPRFFAMKKRLLVLAHRGELLEQAAASFRRLAPDRTVAIEQGASRATSEAQIVVASVPTVGRAGKRLEQLAAEDFYLVVVDEAHHAVAPTYRRVFDHFGLLGPTERLLVGFTATPRRGDKRGLSEIFEEVVFTRTLPRMIAEGWLAPVRGYRVSSTTGLDGVRVLHGDFVESDLARAVNVGERNDLVVEAYARLGRDRRALVFCVDVAHAQAVAEAFAGRGFRARAVWGAMEASERRRTLRAFSDGELDVLTNCNVLTEGYDEPRVDCIVLARPTRSQALYAQMVGRGTRLHPEKSDALAIDIADVSTRHRLVCLQDLFDLPPEIDLEGRSAEAVARELDRIASEMPWIDLGAIRRAGELELVAERVDLFRFERPKEIASITRFQWCAVPDGGYRLNLAAGERVTVRPDHLGVWLIEQAPRPFLGLPPSRPDAIAAIRAVDRAVEKERSELVDVLDVRSAWRGRPATERQLEVLARNRVAHPSGLTRGQASWLVAMSSTRGRSTAEGPERTVRGRP